MNVEVMIEVSIPPKENDLDNLRRAASALTNTPGSITVRTAQAGDRISLITNFTMRTTAQYKVVDDIYREFKFWTLNLESYENMTISFPKQAGGIANE
jgi:hypothetical protein